MVLSLRKNKKGQMTDLFILGPIILVIFLAVLIAMLWVSNMGDSILSNPEHNNTHTRLAIERTQTTLSGFDLGILIIAIGLLFAVFVSAFFIDTHPVFMIISIILLIVAVGIGAIWENMYTQVVSTSSLADTAAQYSAADFLFSRWSLILAIGGMIAIIALYAKRPSSTF